MIIITIFISYNQLIAKTMINGNKWQPRSGHVIHLLQLCGDDLAADHIHHQNYSDAIYIFTWVVVTFSSQWITAIPIPTHRGSRLIIPYFFQRCWKNIVSLLFSQRWYFTVAIAAQAGKLFINVQSGLIRSQHAFIHFSHIITLYIINCQHVVVTLLPVIILI